MGLNSGISWCQASWNPWQGCHKVSPGCKLCYAERDFAKYGKNFNVVVRSKTTFNDPLKWHKNGKLAAGSRIFTCSWSDWFIEEADEWRDEAWNIIKNTPNFYYMILTKRSQNIKARLPADWADGYPNVWLGVTVEAKEQLHRIERLADIPCRIRFVSYEPALGPVSFKKHHSNIDWIISGGESDPVDPRPADMDWFRTIRDDCLADGIPFFFKQVGGKDKIDGVWGGDQIDGTTYHSFPETQ